MSGHCPKCGAYHEEDDDRLCPACKPKPISLDELRAAGLRLPDGFSDAADYVADVRHGGRDARITELETALAVMTKDRDAQAEAVRVLAAECEMSRVCVEPDPIYGWDEPRHLADHYMDWRELGKMREQTDANPIAAAAVEGKETQ